jgi:hypothetical protein
MTMLQDKSNQNLTMTIAKRKEKVRGFLIDLTEE